ncbi:MAG: tannase/feruloyl esterase family alpha/beta hydrolase [Rhodobacter sp.]|nr:tannase/feruloyl esterase family alpha/beta hydrolase [Rhodobacter sp.]
MTGGTPMKRYLAGTVIGLSMASSAFGADCNVAGLTPPAGVTLETAEAVAVGDGFERAHCRFTGRMNDRTGVDGMSYALKFELRLPDDWNGRFVHQFNGGNDGEVKPAIGELNSGYTNDTALNRGYAVVSSDAGHSGDAFPDAGLAGGARFGFDPAARAAYGYSAVADLQPVATALTEAYYGQDIAFAYGVGRSNGGRHAMVAASRMPEAFDGLLVGYPGFNLPRAALQHALDVQSFRSVDADLKSAFPREDLEFVATAILAACDGLDGLKDGWIADADRCQDTFDPKAMVCREGQNSDCLSAAQVAALETIHAGPKAADGSALYSDWAWDAGIASGSWRFWKLESPIPPWGHKPIIAVMGAASLAQIFTTPPTRVEGSPEALEQYLMDFDIAAEAEKIFATDGSFDQSAMAVMTPPDVDDPTLAEFRDAGGKMLILHGNSDPVFSVQDTARWYRKLDENNGGNAGDFVLFYRNPGQPHSMRGPHADGFDMFTPLVNWVENGVRPGAINTEVTEDNNEGRAALGVVGRKLCPYPQVARYTGADPASSDSFSCQ